MNQTYGTAPIFAVRLLSTDDFSFHFSQQYFRLIDDCITKIVFPRLACDPDFDTFSMDSESIGDSGLGLHDHTPSIRTASTHDLSPMPRNAETNVIKAENEIQISVMKGRVEHLEKTREKLIEALNAIIGRVTDSDAI